MAQQAQGFGMRLAPIAKLAVVLLLWLTTALVAAQEPTAPDNTDVVLTSANGHFVVGYEPHLQPIGINQIHTWTVHVETTQGTAVDDADIRVVGGMPVHDHGLPTLPQSMSYLGDGNYLVEGMKFHMNGWWQVTVTVRTDDVTDTVIFNLVL